jgi:hypothetical protein
VDLQGAAKLLRELLMRNGDKRIFEIGSKDFNGRIGLLHNVNQSRDIFRARDRGFRCRRRDCKARVSFWVLLRRTGRGEREEENARAGKQRFHSALLFVSGCCGL